MIESIFLGTTELTANNRFVISVRNGGFPEVDFSQQNKGGSSGSKISDGKLSAYRLTIEWRVVGSTFSDLATQRENFVALLGQILSDGGKTLKINKSNGTDVQIDIKGINVVTDVQTSDPLNAPILTEMTSEYPLLQSQILQVETANIFQGGGMAIPMDIPMNMGNGGTNELTIANAGNYNAYPIFKFYGPLSFPTLTNVTTGEALNIATSLADAGEMLEVDTFLRTAIFLPSGNNARRYVSGDFWTVAIGNNIIHLGSSSYNAIGKCEIYFRDSFLNI